ncbi:hypothetical protein CONCODRAFT_155093 [Conidiobolus coronatus NRRL 28638]|uniref:Uncharacterized protein n=1 Tax=Conidiobolus coronatus (strain ATCC 28846 / CBS 209.66 / NRRL 28638) TaxID=796925 RepID=A0A137PHK5_CONC2|nr:hypothetical protein CONCODRAFT_155093 [Conidiobolus coronatus NRRL 28638]|eukprot:KXN74421.1 hypothetical protein CONCODRAFT_155093 [Conidiobolus coronatus NRRL 28638]
MAFSSTSQTIYSTNASIRPNPKPRFLRDPTTIESISSAITGISSYVRKNLPESLKGKQSGFKSSPSNQSSPINSESGFSAIESLRSFSTESKNKVLFADFDYFQDNPNSPKIECLVLGYQDGFQIWNMEDYSNITDIITTTTFLGNVKSMKLVPPSPIANSTRTPLLLVG